MLIKSVAVIFVILVGGQAAKLPSYFDKCKKDDNFNDCILASELKGFPSLVEGDPSVHVVPLDPLHVNEMFIDVDGNLKINFTNFDITGLKDSTMENMKWDWENKKIFLDIRLPLAALVGEYDIAGKILILPIQGQGPCNITYVNGLFKFEFDYEMEEKNNKEYVIIQKGKMSYEVDRIYFGLENLFGGDARLGEEMKKFLDENWKEVNGEIGVRVGDALAEVYTSVVKSFLSRVPTNELWDEE